MSLIRELLHWISGRRKTEIARSENWQLMQQVPTIAAMSTPARVFLFDKLYERSYKHNEQIFDRGAPGVCVFLVKVGRVEIYADGEEEEGRGRTVFATVGKAQVFGEMAAIALGSRSTSARAVGQGAALLALSRQDLDAFMDLYPRDGINLLRGVMEIIAHNLEEVHGRLQACEARLHQLQPQQGSGHEQ